MDEEPNALRYQGMQLINSHGVYINGANFTFIWLVKVVWAKGQNRAEGKTKHIKGEINWSFIIFNYTLHPIYNAHHFQPNPSQENSKQHTSNFCKYCT